MQAKPVIEVFVFLNVECPVSNRYVPELRRLAKEFSPAGVRWKGIFPDRDLSQARIKKWERDYEPGFDVTKDYYLEETRRAKARNTPEAAIYVDKKLVYRGRIDDRYSGWGRYKQEATRGEVRLVLEAALAGKPISVEWEKALGCAIDR